MIPNTLYSLWVLYGQDHVAYSPMLFLFGEVVNNDILVNLNADENVEVHPNKHEEIFEDPNPNYDGISEDHPETNGHIVT